MKVLSRTEFIKVRSEFEDFLSKWTWCRFVTLSTNDPTIGAEKAIERLRKWDAFVNRELVGKDWARRPEDRMWSFYFLEKADAHAHWHGVVRFMSWAPWHQERFDNYASQAWKKLMPSGSSDIQPVSEQSEVVKYVAKSVANSVSYEHYVVPDGFR
jgi:hypothetical protein